MENVSENFSIVHNISNSWTMKDFHIHDMYEIYFSLSSNIKCFLNNKIYNVERGDLFLFTHLDLHKIVVPQGLEYERYVILFNPKLVQSISTEITDLLKCFNYKEDKCFRIKEGDFESLLILFKDAIKYSKDNSYGSDIYRKITLVEILILINKFLNKEKPPSTTTSGGSSEKIVPILSYIEENISENLSLDLLCQKFYISKFYLENLFKKNTGFSIGEYIINNRILKAKQLLKKGLTVSEVSELVGFNSTSHFIRTFKKHVNISPKQYVKYVKV